MRLCHLFSHKNKLRFYYSYTPVKMSQVFKFAPRLRELRVHLCQTGESSKGVRDFIEKYYVGLKSCNPRFPILIRECSGVQPVLWARFEKGKECSENLSNLSADQVLQKIQNVAK